MARRAAFSNGPYLLETALRTMQKHLIVANQFERASVHVAAKMAAYDEAHTYFARR